MSTGENNGTPGPNHDADPPSERTRFLLRLLDDQEHDRLRPVEDYIAEFEGIADFVRTEHANLVAPSTGRPTGSSLEFAPSRRIGRYELIRVVGEGGMGRAYLAKDPQLSREVVLKALRTDEGPTDPGRERLRREARVLGRLHHPHLAEVLDVLEVEEGIFLVMPFYDGRPLSVCLAEARARTERTHGDGPKWPRLTVSAAMDATSALRAVIGFFTHAASALHAAHEAGVVHRDLKPQNVLVRDDGTPLVLDFGLALPAGDERLTMPGEVLGTPSYMAPEQIEGRAVDARADVYALAVMLYEALTLVQPFAGSGGREATFHRVLKGDPLSPRKHQPLVPRDLEAVVLKGMEREPSRRYADAAAFARELDRVLDLEPTEARPVSGFTRWMRKVVHRRRMAAVVGALVVVGGSFAVYAWQVEASSRKAQEERRISFEEIQSNFFELRRKLEPNIATQNRVSEEQCIHACEFLVGSACEDLVSASQWDAWSRDLLGLVRRDPGFAYATRLLEAKGVRAFVESDRVVGSLVREFEDVVSGWPRGTEQAPRRAWAAVAAARWVLWNGRNPLVARRITSRALAALEREAEWPSIAEANFAGADEFWITERNRPDAGSRADARAELRMLHGEANWELGLGAEDLDAAVVMLAKIGNVHRLANALASRARVRLEAGEFDGALQDALWAGELYARGFMNKSFPTLKDREVDEPGVADMQRIEREIRERKAAAAGSSPRSSR